MPKVRGAAGLLAIALLGGVAAAEQAPLPSASVAAGSASATAAAHADNAGNAPPGAAVPAAAPLSAELVKTGLYLISGGGSNTLMRLSASGTIVVDGKLPGQYRPLMSQMRRINKLSDLPTRVLIVTDHHPQHSGNVPQFVAAGVAVLVQDHAKSRLPAIPAPAASASRAPGPVVGFDRDYKLRMGGVEVQVFHYGPGHTDNDAVFYFPDLQVIAVGDLLTAEVPVPDVAAGGSLVGWRAALEQVLKLDFEIVVPSTGPLATRADLQAFKARLDTLISVGG